MDWKEFTEPFILVARECISGTLGVRREYTLDGTLVHHWGPNAIKSSKKKQNAYTCRFDNSASHSTKSGTGIKFSANSRKFYQSLVKAQYLGCWIVHVLIKPPKGSSSTKHPWRDSTKRTSTSTDNSMFATDITAHAKKTHQHQESGLLFLLFMMSMSNNTCVSEQTVITDYFYQ